MKQQTRLLIGFLSLTLLFGIGILTSVITTSCQGNQENSTAANYLQALINFEPWAESVWKDYPSIPGSGYFGDGETEGNGGIRGTCGIALSYVVLIRAFPDAPERSHRLKRVEEALRYAVETHRSSNATVFAVDGKKWGQELSNPSPEGYGDQSSMWAGSMGFAAAFLERELDPKLVEGCKRVVGVEADWISKLQPLTGYKLDTKSEETGWQSNIVTLAAAWMPQDPRAGKWLNTAKLWSANTYTVPADSTGPLKEWIKTQTMYPSFGIENHGFFHPSYEIAGAQSLGDIYTMICMINPEVARELRPFVEHNVIQVWNLVKGIILDNGDLAFPSGMDWSLHQFEHINYLAWMATHFREPEAQWAERKLSRQILYRQAINGDGRFVGESCHSGGKKGSTDGFYVEAVQALMIAAAYFHNEVAGFPSIKGSRLSNHVTNYPDIGLIVQRSENAMTTVSYGARTMSLVYPFKGKSARQQFITSPNPSSLIGTDGKTILKSFKKTETGFHMELILNGVKSKRESLIIIESEPEIVVYIEIPSDTGTIIQRDWYLAAIENHPLTGGEREVMSEKKSQKIRERSGTTTGPMSTGWINIDNWMGYIAVPEGKFIYSAASDYNRRGAAEDALVFQPEDAQSPRAVIILPGKNAAATKKVQKSLKWESSDIEYKLSFIMPGGKKKEIQVPISELK